MKTTFAVIRKDYAKQAGALICGAALAFTMLVPSTAFAGSADDARDAAARNVSSTPSSSVVTGAATRAAMPSLEILGINSVEESGQFVSVVNGVPQYSWEQPKYYLCASSYNSSPSTYLANLASSSSSAMPKAIFNSSRHGEGKGPNAALASYGGTTSSNDDAIWNLKPNVIVGTNGGGIDTYSTAASQISDYSPKGANYSISNYSSLISSMDNIVAAADASVSSGDAQGRYGDISAIAQDYENYINNTTSYVKANRSSTKSFVVVTNVSTDSNGKNVYEVMTTDSADGTASSNRYFETASRVATNYAAGGTGSIGANDIKKAVKNGNLDLILVGGQSSSSNYDSIISALESDKLISSTYFVHENGSQGSMYGVTMNSVENAQNIGRIYGCLYPELIDQDAFIAYYYNHFYHISDDPVSGYDDSNLAYVIDQAMDGVRNWDATDLSTEEGAYKWEAGDVANWSTLTNSKGHTVSQIVDGTAN